MEKNMRSEGLRVAVTMEEEALLADALAFVGESGSVEHNSNLSHELLEFLGEFDSEPAMEVTAEQAIQDLNEQAPIQFHKRGRSTDTTIRSSTSQTALPVQTPPTLRWPTAVMQPLVSGKKPRTKRHAELANLRSLVGTLEQQLVATKRGAIVNQSMYSSLTGDIPSNALLAAWESVATRQREQRKRSESENVRLKRQLRDQIRLGKSLETLLLRKRPRLEVLVVNIRPETHKSSPLVSTAWNDETIFTELVATVNAQYAETDKAFAAADHRCASVNHNDSGLVEDSNKRVGIQTVECHLFPFNYDDVVKELWAVSPELPSGKLQDIHCVEQAYGIKKVSFKVDALVGSVRGVLHVHMVVRRFVESRRTVILSATIITPTRLSDTDMDGIHMRHTNWTVVESVQDHALRSSSQATGSATKLRTRAVGIPEIDKPVDDQHAKVDAFAHFLLSAMTVEFDIGHHDLENRLLMRSLNLERP